MSNRAINWAYAQNLPALEKFVLVTLADEANDEGMVVRGRGSLSRKTGISERSLRRYCVALEERGLLAVEWRRAGQRRANSRYLLALEQTFSSGHVGRFTEALKRPTASSEAANGVVSSGQPGRLTIDRSRASSKSSPQKDPGKILRGQTVDNSTGEEPEGDRKIQLAIFRALPEYRRMMGLKDDAEGVGVTGDLDLGRAAAAFDTNREKAETAGSWGGRGMAGALAGCAGIKPVDDSQLRPGESRIAWELRRARGENAEKGAAKPVEDGENARKR